MGGIFDVLALAFIVGVIYVLVRPGSHAADLVEAVGKLTIGLVRQATDLATA